MRMGTKGQVICGAGPHPISRDFPSIRRRRDGFRVESSGRGISFSSVSASALPSTTPTPDSGQSPETASRLRWHRRIHACWPGAALLSAVILGATISPRGADSTPAAGTTPGGLPVGTIVAFGGPAASVPEAGGWLLCDGRELGVLQYPELHAVLRTAWGQGRNSGTFLIPDLRGRFLRGVNYAAPGEMRDPDRDQRGTSGPGGNSGNEVGSLQEDAAGPHQHPLSGVADAIGQGAGAEWIRFHGSKVPDESAAVLSNTWSIQPPGQAETRPRNVYVNWIIRAR